ncbi:MAG: hypothetical protein OEY34_01575 [Cyclobacteriaceae bacterium]|nr:hypothetical protein [Cyclobacteriaceae bacterium]
MKVIKMILGPVVNFWGSIVFRYQMDKLARELFKNRMVLKASSALPVMIVHYDKSIIDAANVYEISPQIEKMISEPFKKIHGYPPAVMMMPFGMTFSSVNWNNFVDLLNTEQRTEIQNALYRKKGKIITLD